MGSTNPFVLVLVLVLVLDPCAPDFEQTRTKEEDEHDQN
jgi:hypothetical protein